MREHPPIQAAIVDYALGNLYSVKQACHQAGMAGSITSSKEEILSADVVLLPGVGAFGDAMKNLEKLDLVGPLRGIAASGKPLVGICLGQQLLMTESYEFGTHAGLGIIEGPVVRFENPESIVGAGADKATRKLKVPQIGWNVLRWPEQAHASTGAQDPWWDTPLNGLPEGVFMYFVHSYYTRPANPEVVLAVSDYGGVEFCASLRYNNVFACQFHPERSGSQGLQIYHNIAAMVRDRKRERHLV
jgi:glutamine amidotransferase